MHLGILYAMFYNVQVKKKTFEVGKETYISKIQNVVTLILKLEILQNIHIFEIISTLYVTT